MDHKTTAKSYDKQAGDYEKRWHGYLKNTYQVMHSVLEIKKADKILDASAGTGLFAQEILEDHSAQEMILNDVSSEMQSIAKTRLADYKNITFTGYAAGALNFKPASFDHIISLNAYHNYPDQEQFLKKGYDLLKPGACLYILDWNRKGSFKIVNSLISFFTKETINTSSANEAGKQLSTLGLDILSKKEWQYKYWKLFLIKCQKPKRDKN